MSVFSASFFVSKSSALLRGSLILGFAAVISACGGGGGGGSDAPAKPVEPGATYPIAAAYNKLIIDGAQEPVKVSATVDGDSANGTGTINFSAANPATFEGVSGRLRTDMTISAGFYVDGDFYPFSFSNVTYYDSNYREVGAIFLDDSYALVTVSHDLPAEARVGDSGDLYAYTAYSGPSKISVQGSATSSYHVESDSASSVILRISVKFYDAGKALVETDDFRYRIDAAGNIKFVSIATVSSDNSEKVDITTD